MRKTSTDAEEMNLDNSFDANDVADLASVVAEFPENDDHPGERIPIKKLCDEFESVAKSDKDSMKVYLRVRPITDMRDSTVKVDSDIAISTCAPESSKRANYTKTEQRHYVRTHANAKTNITFYSHGFFVVGILSSFRP